MPTYDYRCQKCKKKFTVKMTITDHDRKRIQCPKCSSRDVVQAVQAFFATTSKKS